MSTMLTTPHVSPDTANRTGKPLKFAFIIHPLDARRDIAGRGGVYSVARYLPTNTVEALIKHKSPMVASHITGLRSEGTGQEAEGWFIGCPLTPRQLMEEPLEFVYKRLMQCAELAVGLGAGIIGLGAFTSVVGDGGITIHERMGGRIAVTTGNSYTIATAVEGARRGAELMGTPLCEANVAVVGAAGSIGRTCALMLARDAGSMTLVGRHLEKLRVVEAEVAARNPNVTITDDIAAGLKNADVIITVTSAAEAVILPEYLKRGAVVCDVARPRDVSVRVAKERDDVLIIEGGLVAVPGDVDFHFNFGFPPKTAYACMSETMMLALDGRYESFTLGKEVSVEQAEETQRLATKHGFRLAGFRSFEKAVTDETIEKVRRAAGRDRLPKPKAAPTTPKCTDYRVKRGMPNVKLAEALVLRADTQKRIEQLRERLKASVLVQEGEEPPENPQELFAELERLLAQVTDLIKRINQTNLQATLAGGKTLTDALADRDSLTLYHKILESTVVAATPQFDRMGRAEIRKIPTVKVGDLRRLMDETARQRRELDTSIQAANWTTELLGSE